MNKKIKEGLKFIDQIQKIRSPLALNQILPFF